MKGQRVPEHITVRFDPREGDAIRDVMQSALADEEFPLNEFEEETLENFINVLEEEAAQI